MVAEDALKLGDVGELGDVVEGQRVGGQHPRDHQGKRGVLGARNRDSAVEPLAADDANPIHDAPAAWRGLCWLARFYGLPGAGVQSLNLHRG